MPDGPAVAPLHHHFISHTSIHLNTQAYLGSVSSFCPPSNGLLSPLMSSCSWVRMDALATPQPARQDVHRPLSSVCSKKTESTLPSTRPQQEIREETAQMGNEGKRKKGGGGPANSRANLKESRRMPRTEPACARPRVQGFWLQYLALASSSHTSHSSHNCEHQFQSNRSSGTLRVIG